MFNGPLDVTAHGVWVRSTRTDDFGRIAYMVYDRTYDGDVEAFVMWEPEKGTGKSSTARSASYHTPAELNVRPYKPRPWHKQERICKEVRYGPRTT